jgi:hypothetical protein
MSPSPTALPNIRLLPPPPPPAHAPVQTTSPGQQELPLEFVLPGGLPASPPAVPTTVQERRGIAPWAARLAQAVLEVEAAERPVNQLGRWVAPEIYRRLDRRQQLRTRQLGTHGTRPRCPEQVRSVHVCQPTPDVAEVSVVTAGGVRCRALALRLERRRGRWLCTALDWA